MRELDGGQVGIRPGTADADVAIGAFVGRYHLPPQDLGSPQMIWDLGCNIGLTMRQMAHRFQRATVVGVDLDPENLALAEENLAPVADRCVLLEGAIWPESGELSYARDGGEDAYKVSEGAAEKATAITLDDLLERFGPPDYVKMDIEGAESEVLTRNTSWAPSVGKMSVECHQPYGLERCSADLRALGYATQTLARGLLRRGSDSVWAQLARA